MNVRPGLETLEDRCVPARHVAVLDYRVALTVEERSRITARVRYLLRDTDTKVVVGNGDAWLRRGFADPDLLVTVARIANRGLAGFAGQAFQADVGDNVEWTGFVYAGNIRDRFPLPYQFSATVAAVAVHEMGHLLGLGHPVVNDPANVMNWSIAVAPWNMRLKAAPVKAVLYHDGVEFRGPQSGLREWLVSPSQE